MTPEIGCSAGGTFNRVADLFLRPLSAACYPYPADTSTRLIGFRRVVEAIGVSS